MHIVLVGMNHRTADLDLRQRCALDREKTLQALNELRKYDELAEAVILSTCNRVEIAAAGLEPDRLAQRLEHFLADLGDIDLEQLRPCLYRHLDDQAARHLMSVASGLDSMVPGESQILGQTRQAYLWASCCDTVGRLLNGLFQRTFAAAKRIRTQTDLDRGQLSVSSVAVDLAGRVFDNFADKTALVIGAGETGKLTLVHLAQLGLKKLLVSNRTPQRAQRLAERFAGEVVPLEQLNQRLHEADLVICSTASAEPVLTTDDVKASLSRRRGRRLLIIDLAVPRDVEPAVGDFPDVFLYNVDDLEEIVQANLAGRRQAAEEASDLIETEVERFREWLLALDLGALVSRLRETLHRQG